MHMKNKFKLGQNVVYTDGLGTTRSAQIVNINENAVRIGWRIGPGRIASVPMSHAQAEKWCVPFPDGIKFMAIN